MANKKKAAKIVIKMHNPETGFFYTKTKNTKSENTQGKMKMRKYDPKLRKHAVFTETKMPS
jgi:large subunit ribosomal protein L33